MSDGHLKKFFTGAKSRRGFTLLELAIVMLTAGLLLAGGLALYNVRITKQNFDVTRQRLENIRSAMASYQAQNGYLPCPAPMTAGSQAPEFGRAGTTLCNGTALTPGTQRAAGTGGRMVRIGAVPVADLGLSSDDSIDKWGNRFVYAVSEKLAEQDKVNNPYNATNGAITLLGDGVAVYGPLPGQTPFVVYSVGPSGAGGVSSEGQPTGKPCPSSGPAVPNCLANSSTFRAGSFSSSDNTALRSDSLMVNTLVLPRMEELCGSQGMIYGPEHPRADVNGCVPLVIQRTNGSIAIGVGAATAPVSGAVVDVIGEVRVGSIAAAPPPPACTAATAGAMVYGLDTAEAPPEMRIFFCGPNADPPHAIGWRTLRGPTGPIGPTGPPGLLIPGADGPPGPPGPDCVAAPAVPVYYPPPPMDGGGF